MKPLYALEWFAKSTVVPDILFLHIAPGLLLDIREHRIEDITGLQEDGYECCLAR